MYWRIDTRNTFVVMNLSREIISSWKLQGDKLLSEELLLSYGFSKYAHIVFENFPGLPNGTSYDVYRLVIAERDNLYMEVRYAFFDGFIGLYIIDKETSKSSLIDERYHEPAWGRGFKNYLKHKALKYIDGFLQGINYTKSKNDWVFNSDFRKVTFY